MRPGSLRRSLIALTLAAPLGACRAPQADEPAPPPTELHETATVDPAHLCDEPLRSWAVLDEAGEVQARSRGRCLGAVEHPEDGELWHLVAQLQEVDAAAPSWELHTWVDDAGRPRHAEFRTPELVTRYRWRDGALSLRRLGDELELGPGSGALWVTPEHGLFIRELMFRLGVGVEDGRVRQQSWLPERDRVAELALELRRSGDRAEARGASSSLALDGADAGLAGLHIAAVRAGDTLVYEPLPPGADALADFLPARPRPSYEAPADLEILPVEVPAAGPAPRLAGELVLPPQREAPLPGVLFLSGAGPQDRHGLVPRSAVDIGSHELQDALARAGFAVLRVDDRGVGESGVGDDPNPGFSALTDDGRRALAALAALPEVDARRIILVGHGEGALHASILADERTRVAGRRVKIAGLIVLAGPGRALRELIYDEIRASMLGEPEGAVRMAVDRARRAHDAALSDGELPASSEGARAWMIEAFAEDPLARLEAVDAPVLAIQGGKDFQVSPERDFGPIRALLEGRGDEASEAALFPELDHLLKPEPFVSTPGHYADLRRRVDPAVVELVVGWAEARAGSY